MIKQSLTVKPSTSFRQCHINEFVTGVKRQIGLWTVLVRLCPELNRGGILQSGRVIYFPIGILSKVINHYNQWKIKEESNDQLCVSTRFLLGKKFKVFISSNIFTISALRDIYLKIFNKVTITPNNAESVRHYMALLWSSLFHTLLRCFGALRSVFKTRKNSPTVDF